MKSFGNLNKQAWNGLITLGTYYKNAKEYSVTIFTPTSECYYSMDGDILNPYVKNLDGDEINETEIMNSLDYKFWESYVNDKLIYENSDVESRIKENYFMDRRIYESIKETGITSSVLYSVIDLKIKFSTENCS